jgi:hypothetical protein
MTPRARITAVAEGADGPPFSDYDDAMEAWRTARRTLADPDAIERARQRALDAAMTKWGR